MKIARLGAAGAAAGVIALGAAGPAFATGTTPPAPGGDMSKLTSPSPSGKPGAVGPSADVNPKFFYGGQTLTFTVTNCAVHPTILDVNGLFVSHHAFVETGKGSFAAKEVTKKNLVAGKEYKVIVKCGDWTDTFTTKPQKKPTPKPTPPSTAAPTGVPSGAPQTGDGSSNGGGNTGLMVGGAAVVLVGLAGGTFLYTRRRSSAGA
jgi:hypothetical protein